MWLDIQRHEAIKKLPTFINMRLSILINAASFDEMLRV